MVHFKCKPREQPVRKEGVATVHHIYKTSNGIHRFVLSLLLLFQVNVKWSGLERLPPPLYATQRNYKVCCNSKDDSPCYSFLGHTATFHIKPLPNQFLFMSCGHLFPWEHFHTAPKFNYFGVKFFFTHHMQLSRTWNSNRPAQLYCEREDI